MFTPRSFGKVGVEAYAAYALRAWLAREHSIRGRTRRFAKWSAICSFALGMAGQVAYHLLAQAGAARAPWPVTTIVSCLPVLVLAMGTALAHMLRADAEAGISGQPDRPRAVRGPVLVRARTRTDHAADTGGDPDRSVSRDQNGPKPGPQAGRGTRGPGQRPAQPQVEQARLVARRLAAAGKPVSRRALRGAGITGSNQALNALARRINAEQAGATPPEPISPG